MKTFAVAAALALVFAGSAQAWKPTTHLYTASVAIADKPGPVAKIAQPPDNVMLGWIRCMDCDHQWRQYSIHDPATDTTDWLPIRNELNHQVQTVFQYGEGSFFRWQDCAARQRVLRPLLEGWGTGWGNQPGFPDMVPTEYRASDACP